MEPTALEGPAVPSRFVADLLGVTDPEQARLAARLIPALERISPDLVPRAVDHPFIEAIEEGIGAFPDLLAAYDQAKDDDDRVVVLDAIARIIDRHYATLEVVDALERILASAKSSAVVTTAGRCLALAGDEGFIAQQRQFLISPSLVDVRVAARLLGYAEDEGSVPLLLTLLRPDRAVVLDAVVWALGQIGDERAVPGLHAMLERFVQTDAVLEALGKIASRSSVMRILPLVLEGVQGQREAAAAALARIVHEHDGSLGDPALGRSVREALEKVVARDPSTLVRFFALLGFARLGGHMEPNRVLAALGGELSKEELEGISGFLAKGAPGDKKAKPRKGRGRV